MGYTEVQTLDADVTTALGGSNRKTGKKNPSSIEGYYLGMRQVESKKAKNGYCQLHFFQTGKGNVGVWGKTDLDRKLATVTPGTMVRATHTGMQATPNGDMYKYKVEIDSGNTIEVSNSPILNATLESDDDEDTSEDYSSDSDETEEAGRYQDDGELAAARQASRKHVESLLSKGKK